VRWTWVEKEQLEQHLEDCEELQRVHRETEAVEDQIKKMKAATKVINENIDVNNQEVANTLAKNHTFDHRRTRKNH